MIVNEGVYYTIQVAPVHHETWYPIVICWDKRMLGGLVDSAQKIANQEKEYLIYRVIENTNGEKRILSSDEF